ncbi:hypothetical protein DL89DRAFT_254144 [Linderina pennispora]|uniref:Uncharacterized protein n=1 Tax=Linderina pennispora TaxID=61395 RepID=A0A1Y1WL28_9FUNG|nr:uncharacterized protein DL89DRAFT_254144 [Linderina pennispora]ORX74280.1 hypothetical protein DL89DRAFT_254144 [Linderina pennispora]
MNTSPNIATPSTEVDLPSQIHPATGQLERLQSINNKMSSEVSSLLLSAYKEILVLTISKHNVALFLPSTAGPVRDNSTNQHDQSLVLSERVDKLDKAVAELILDYRHITDDIIKSAAGVGQDTPDAKSTNPKFVHFSLFKFFESPTQYLDTLTPDSIGAAQKGHYLKELLILHAPPLVKYYIENDLKGVTDSTMIGQLLDKDLCCRYGITYWLKSERDWASSCKRPLNEVVSHFSHHRSGISGNRYCSLRDLAACCTEAQQKQLVSYLHKCGIKRAADHNFAFSYF